MDRRGKVLRAPDDAPFESGTLVRVIEANDEASLRRDYDFKSIPRVLQPGGKPSGRGPRRRLRVSPTRRSAEPCSSA
jgi:hypothetical protein